MREERGGGGERRRGLGLWGRGGFAGGLEGGRCRDGDAE